MCICYWKGESEEVVERPERNIHVLTSLADLLTIATALLDGKQILWDSNDGTYYNPVTSGKPASSSKRIVVHTITEQPKKPEQIRYIGGNKKFIQPKGTGYSTIDDAIAAAKSRGEVISSSDQVHVMRTAKGGWDIVGVDRAKGD